MQHLALVVAAWIAACAARGAQLPAGHFTDPLDEALDKLFVRSLPARDVVDAVFGIAGFAAGADERERLVALVAAHLQILRGKGVAAALAAGAIEG